MTAQITDACVYQNEVYEVIWDAFLVPYIRQTYDLAKHIAGFTTICDRGYVAKYEIENAHLYLTEIQVFGMTKAYPTIGNAVGEELFSKTKSRKREAIHSGWVKYSPVKERINASGYLVLGQAERGYEDEMQNAALYPYAYKKLIGINFVSGQPKQIENFSQEAALLRTQLTKRFGADESERDLIEQFHKRLIKA